VKSLGKPVTDACGYFQPRQPRRPGIEVHNETLGDELVGYGKTRHEAGSFHAPVVAEFELP
jgi:hypothetical protein